MQFQSTLRIVKHLIRQVNNPIGEGKYYRKALTDGTFVGLPVTMTAKEEEVIELDGTIFGLKWASANTKSYIDCSISDDDAWIFSYIPDITFAEQGLGGFKYITEESVEKDNNVVYHYQWDRDFGCKHFLLKVKMKIIHRLELV